MSQSTTPSEVAYTWDDPNRCPFCLDELADPGSGFVAHLDESPVCKRGFDTWRTTVANDMRGEWSG
ncbi:DUF7501 family protein [Halogeometricum limi]|uniref:Uncharacterized protein n=1 Tax=Halogeometricum limi TaxID=555875 RepID=A0A1I6GMX9_9EURY|nr:hypothetical protein [Halogeometricum limi]SFR43550.1 hypothetical protein SAMN04488124_1291 [Halogeometricum limi]